MEWTSCAVVYSVSHGLVWSRTVSHGLVWSCTIANTIIHGHGTRVSFLKVLKIIHVFLRIHSNGPSVTPIRPRLIQLYVRFTRMANCISCVFCARQALSGGLGNTEISNRLRQAGPEVINLFMLNSAEHEILTALKVKSAEKIKIVLALKLSDVVFILLINVKMSAIIGILTFMNRVNFMLT